MGFQFPLEDPDVARSLKSYHFAGGMRLTRRGRHYFVGKLMGVDWPDNFNVDPRDFLRVMKRIHGEPNGQSDDKVTFNYIFKSNIPRVYYEIRDYRGFLSCGVGLPLGFSRRINQRLTNQINNELLKLIQECVAAYNLMS